MCQNKENIVDNTVEVKEEMCDLDALETMTNHCLATFMREESTLVDIKKEIEKEVTKALLDEFFSNF